MRHRLLLIVNVLFTRDLARIAVVGIAPTFEVCFNFFQKCKVQNRQICGLMTNGSHFFRLPSHCNHDHDHLIGLGREGVGLGLEVEGLGLVNITGINYIFCQSELASSLDIKEMVCQFAKKKARKVRF